MEAKPSPAAAASWAAASVAREWLAAIRLHASCVAHSAACLADVEADEAVMQATADARRALDAQGGVDAAAIERAAAAIVRASDATRRAAKSYRRSSKLEGAAASETMRACRACRRAADEEHAGNLRDRVKMSRKNALDAARQADAADKRADGLMRDADRMAACAAVAAAAGGSIKEGLRELSLSMADLWEDAKRNRLDSAAAAGKAAEAERLAVKARRLATSAANMAADDAAAAVAAASDGADDPNAERASAAWRRAMAAANRADAAAGRGRSGSGSGSGSSSGSSSGSNDDDDIIGVVGN